MQIEFSFTHILLRTWQNSQIPARSFWRMAMPFAKGTSTYTAAVIRSDGDSQRNIAYWELSGKLKGRQEILGLAKALKVP